LADQKISCNIAAQLKRTDMPAKKFFEVEVRRIGWGFRTIKVYADDQVEAEQIALDTAGDYEFSEHSADYDISGGGSSPEVTERELSQIEYGIITIHRATGVPTSVIWRAIRPTLTGINTKATNLQEVRDAMDCCFGDGEPYPEIKISK
jgi:hypothetical protein